MAARLIELDPNDRHGPGISSRPCCYSSAMSRAIVGPHARPWRPCGMERRSTFRRPPVTWDSRRIAPQRRPDRYILPVDCDHWGSQVRGIRAYRDGRFTDAVRHLAEVPKLDRTSVLPDIERLLPGDGAISDWGRWRKPVDSSRPRESGSTVSGGLTAGGIALGSRRGSRWITDGRSG